MNIPDESASPSKDENHLIQERRDKLSELRKKNQTLGLVTFPNHLRPQNKTDQILEQYGVKSSEELESSRIQVSIAGRVMLKRVMGKASFVTLQDAVGRLQLYISSDKLGDLYLEFKHWDLGDILFAKGYLFKTRTGELSIFVEELQLVTKCLRPLPEKFHGLSDTETKYRQRYVDLLMDVASKERFVLRSKILKQVREYMEAHEFLEVETPMLHPILGGANARPFVTHHNALEQNMYLRIAPELYLKRLLVGGFERVFEINRNFRNEGISVRHNPEFTMMEFYACYWDYRDMMKFTEGLIRTCARFIQENLLLNYADQILDFSSPFEQLTMRQAILKHTDLGQAVDDRNQLIARLKNFKKEELANLHIASLTQLQAKFFEEVVEARLWQPTFICEYPTEISPLARANDSNPDITDRFELFIAGKEVANGFSELNDAEDQAQRFAEQLKRKELGMEETMEFDHDFIRALEYGMPPAAGCGIGIDRLLMLLTNSLNIRDVILFPTLRTEKQ